MLPPCGARCIGYQVWQPGGVIPVTRVSNGMVDVQIWYSREIGLCSPCRGTHHPWVGSHPWAGSGGARRRPLYWRRHSPLRGEKITPGWGVAAPTSWEWLNHLWVVSDHILDKQTPFKHNNHGDWQRQQRWRRWAPPLPAQGWLPTQGWWVPLHGVQRPISPQVLT